MAGQRVARSVGPQRALSDTDGGDLQSVAEGLVCPFSFGAATCNTPIKRSAPAAAIA